MKIQPSKYGEVIDYRVYHRAHTQFKTYMARIVGPDPNYILCRCFVWRGYSSNSRWNTYTCDVPGEGIYEIVIKRFDEEGKYLSRERKWLIYYNGKYYEYEDEDMNYQYVLYCAWLIRELQRDVSAA